MIDSEKVFCSLYLMCNLSVLIHLVGKSFLNNGFTFTNTKIVRAQLYVQHLFK